MQAHVLPRFYLEGFTDPDTPVGQEPYAWYMQADQRVWRRRAPRNLATKPDYYLTAEADLAQIESEAARILRRIVAMEGLEEEDRYTFAVFVAIMAARVPAQHEPIQDFLNERGRKRLALLHTAYSREPWRLEAGKARYREETGRTDCDDLKPADFSPANVEITANRVAVLGFAFSAVVPWARTITEMGWRFLTSNEADYFITSDHPLYIWDGKNLPNGQIKLLDPNVEITLPLTRNVAFFAGWQSEGTQWQRVPTDLVAEINWRSTYGAPELLIAPKPNFPGSSELYQAVPA